MIYNN